MGVENEVGPESDKEARIQELEAQERNYTRLKRAKISVDDFEPLTIIGRAWSLVPFSSLL
jgi:hypothetical protein